MRPSFVNFHGDPFNSDAIAEYTHVQSDGYGGAHEDLTAPAAANFPMVTPTRYFLYLPFVPDQDDLGGARPFLLKDVTGGVALTRVSGAPAANQYRLSPDDSRVPCVVELNSGQVGHVIAYDFYAIGSIAEANDFNNPEVTGDLTVADDANLTDIVLSGDMTGGGTITVPLIKIYDTTTSGYRNEQRRIVNIGAWDMSSPGGDASVTLDLSGLGINLVTGVQVLISDDTSRYWYDLAHGGYYELDYSVGGTFLKLYRTASGNFDNANFNSTGLTRGKVRITYY